MSSSGLLVPPENSALGRRARGDDEDGLHPRPPGAAWRGRQPTIQPLPAPALGVGLGEISPQGPSLSRAPLGGVDRPAASVRGPEHRPAGSA